MESDQIRPLMVLKFAGVYVAGTIGSGFATGQEILQFFSAFGISGIYGSIINAALYCLIGVLLMKQGFRHKLCGNKNIISYYSSKRLSWLFELCLVFMLFGICVIMTSGSGEILSIYFGVSPVVSRLVFCIICFAAVSLGFAGITDILGFLGPVLAIAAVATGAFSFAHSYSHIAASAAFAETVAITRAPGPWWWSAIAYPAFNSIAVLILSVSVGNSCVSEKEATISGITGGIAFGIAVAVLNLGLLSNLDVVYNTQIPVIALVNMFNPSLAKVFAAGILVGIWSGSLPILWSVCSHFAKEHTVKMTITALVLSALMFALSFTNFSRLINILYPNLAYFGLALLGSALFHEFQDKR